MTGSPPGSAGAPGFWATGHYPGHGQGARPGLTECEAGVNTWPAPGRSLTRNTRATNLSGPGRRHHAGLTFTHPDPVQSAEGRGALTRTLTRSSERPPGFGEDAAGVSDRTEWGDPAESLGGGLTPRKGALPDDASPPGPERDSRPARKMVVINFYLLLRTAVPPGRPQPRPRPDMAFAPISKNVHQACERPAS